MKNESKGLLIRGFLGWGLFGGLLVLDQWLFYACKPSFLSRLPVWHQILLLIESLAITLLLTSVGSVLLQSLETNLKKIPGIASAQTIFLHYFICFMLILPISALFASDALPKLILAWFAFGLVMYVLSYRLISSLYERLLTSFGLFNSAFFLLCLCWLLTNVVDRIFYSISDHYLSGSRVLGRALFWETVVIISTIFLFRISTSLSNFFKVVARGFLCRLGIGMCIVIYLICGVHWTQTFLRSQTESQLLSQIDLPESKLSSQTTKPNILLIGIDGVYADHLSVYGYERETSPNIDLFAKDALVYSDVYANTGSTSGSLAAVLTGKRPETTGFFKRPEILRGQHSVQHLPAILRKLGYTNYQITDRYWSDARDINMLGAFHSANGRNILAHHPWIESMYHATGLSGFLLYDTFESTIEIFKNIALMKDKYDPYKQVADFGKHPNMEIGEGNLAAVLNTIDSARNPFFMHAHFLDTHGPWFYLKSGQFTSGNLQQHRYEIDFYDSSIYDFDLKFGLILNRLKKDNLYKDSLIILFSDHGINHDTSRPVPLLIKLPATLTYFKKNGRHELIDIAPTILEILNLKQPHWMEGQSLLLRNSSES